ncbi:hypothetical protein HG535_0F06030 [Zygotorulaspora mrakii]|uniref:Uncharacterized protein n=1 Tax=Zygotorulaspora mrakii TaxID=42260 RepID=A0A7H9B608_ZYGMR|nr:uncharacterized protein HG535_0F06030 [Zygotorulaspora mrakii]QLG74091.1 hypothetical protein HG535_0F06030 [Zygotorulaspora mrakii]
MDDPREILASDKFNNLSSDGEEAVELAKQIDEIERQKKDLLRRLQQKKRVVRVADPNFQEIQIESSPKKRKQEPQKAGLTIQPKIEVQNVNESKVQNDQQLPSNSSPYFVQRYRNAKREEQKELHQRQVLLSSRVHSFAGVDGKQKSKSEPVDEQDEYSSLWLKQRYIPRENLKEALYEVKILRLGKLFAKVKPPKFTEPQYSNWVTVGILSARGEVKFTTGDKPKKFFKFTLTDFQFNLDVFIFGKANVERYYNLRVGDLVAVLNPEILPWRPSGKGGYIKSFNLRISHNFPCILEIGASRDLGWCPVFDRTKNKPCGAPINKAKEKCCDYHKETKFRTTNAKRVELSGTHALGAPIKVDAQPSLYRDKSSRSKNTFKVMPSWSNRGISNHNEQSSTKGYHFSNTNAAKAFFSEKFQNPDLLNNLDSKRRKIQDGKKSLLIDKKLKGLLSKDFYFGTADKNSESVLRATESTLQSGLIQSVGFDPTHGKMAAILKQGSGRLENHKESGKQIAVTDLLKVKKKSVSLKPSREILLEKKHHRDQVWHEHFGKQSSKTSSDSDSDLEIIG